MTDRDDAAARRLRAARRAAARAHHPDLGGDADTMNAAFAALGKPRPAVTVVATSRSRRLWLSLRKRTRRVSRRKYIDL